VQGCCLRLFSGFGFSFYHYCLAMLLVGGEQDCNAGGSWLSHSASRVRYCAGSINIGTI